MLGRHHPFQTVTGTVATAMLTCIGVVCSLTILGLQVASSQLSPRIMRTFVRSNVVTATLAVVAALDDTVRASRPDDLHHRLTPDRSGLG